jgi:4-amino-4-deoxy-L-arabinose transferase-like glycosyltransferase
MKYNNSPVNNTSRLLISTILLLVIATSLYVRIRLLGTPLERDEGEYAYMGQLILKGIVPFTHAYTMKLPGVALAYALIMSIFGQTATGIHIGLTLVNISCAGLVLLLGKRFFSSETAILAAAFFVLLSLSESVYGIHAHATHFILLFSLSGILLLDHALKKNRSPLIFLGGITYGMAFLMKQHAAVMIIFALACQIWPQREGNKRLFHRNGLLFLAGAAAPYVAVVLWVFKAGVFDRFWFWTILYASKYAAGLSPAAGLHEFTHQFTAIVRPNFPIWLLAGGGIAILLAGTRPRTEKLFLSGYLTASCIMVCPGFYFRPHYFVLLLPPIALLAAYAATSAVNFPGTLPKSLIHAFLPVFLLGAAFACSIASEKDYYFSLEPLEVSRRLFGARAFPEAIPIADYIRRHTTETDRIAILGSEPEILFYADRLSATGHIYMYGLMENHTYAEKMQLQLITEIESTMPAIIVIVHDSASWLLRTSSINRVLDWGDRYIPLRYDEVGIVDIFGDRPTRFLWGAESAGYEPESESYVSIYKRRL